MSTEELESEGMGGEVEVAVLLERLSGRFGAILGKFGVPAQDAEDLIGTVLLQYVRKRRGIIDPERWLPGALATECLMYWRTRSRRLADAVDPALLDQVADTRPVDPEREVMRRNLGRFLNKLSPTCQDLLRFRYGLGLDDKEVARRTGYRPASVDKTARRCVESLSRKIATAASRRARP